jgi:hypothetical protein
MRPDERHLSPTSLSRLPTMTTTTANFKNLIHYVIFAANSTKNIAESAQIPILSSTATLCLSISKLLEVS